MDNDDQISAVDQLVPAASARQPNSEQHKTIAWARDILKRTKTEKGSSYRSKQSDIEKFNFLGSSSSTESDDLIIMDLSDYSDYDYEIGEEYDYIPCHRRWTDHCNPHLLPVVPVPFLDRPATVCAISSWERACQQFQKDETGDTLDSGGLCPSLAVMIRHHPSYSSQMTNVSPFSLRTRRILRCVVTSLVVCRKSLSLPSIRFYPMAFLP